MHGSHYSTLASVYNLTLEVNITPYNINSSPDEAKKYDLPYSNVMGYGIMQ